MEPSITEWNQIPEDLFYKIALNLDKKSLKILSLSHPSFKKMSDFYKAQRLIEKWRKDEGSYSQVFLVKADELVKPYGYQITRKNRLYEVNYIIAPMNIRRL